MSYGLIKILMDRDGMTEEEATDLINEAREALMNYLDEGDLLAADDICQEYFGLEPDYIEDLMWQMKGGDSEMTFNLAWPVVVVYIVVFVLAWVFSKDLDNND